MATVTLIIEHGCLCTPDFPAMADDTRKYFLRDNKGIILMFHYDAGDVDTFGWPRTNSWTDEEFRDKLLIALYDAREMGHVPSDTTAATLPDGSTIEF